MVVVASVVLSVDLFMVCLLIFVFDFHLLQVDIYLVYHDVGELKFDF